MQSCELRGAKEGLFASFALSYLQGSQWIKKEELILLLTCCLWPALGCRRHRSYGPNGRRHTQHDTRPRHRRGRGVCRVCRLWRDFNCFGAELRTPIRAKAGRKPVCKVSTGRRHAWQVVRHPRHSAGTMASCRAWLQRPARACPRVIGHAPYDGGVSRPRKGNAGQSPGTTMYPSVVALSRTDDGARKQAAGALASLRGYSPLCRVVASEHRPWPPAGDSQVHPQKL